MAATFTIPATSLPAGSHVFTIDTPAGKTGGFAIFSNATWPVGTTVSILIESSIDNGSSFQQALTSTFTETSSGLAGPNTLSVSFGISPGTLTNLRFTVTNNQAISAPGSGGWI